MTLDDVKAAVEAVGLAYRGAFRPGPEDLPPGAKAGTLVMLGFIGGAQWEKFTTSLEYIDTKPHPLDRWSYRVISGLANEFGAQALFPFIGPPFKPFVRWAQKAEPVYTSAIGMLIHPDYGLSHAWRGALAFEDALDPPPRDDRAHPCDSCTEKPCLAACPVNAFDGIGDFNVAACGAHIQRSEGRECMSLGCRARGACPVGVQYQYSPEQAAFHMKAFKRG